MLIFTTYKNEQCDFISNLLYIHHKTPWLCLHRNYNTSNKNACSNTQTHKYLSTLQHFKWQFFLSLMHVYEDINFQLWKIFIIKLLPIRADTSIYITCVCDCTEKQINKSPNTVHAYRHKNNTPNQSAQTTPLFFSSAQDAAFELGSEESTQESISPCPWIQALCSMDLRRTAETGRAAPRLGETQLREARNAIRVSILNQSDHKPSAS